MTAPERVTSVEFGGARRTIRALVASGLGVLPLGELFTDTRWLFEVWLAMLIAVGPVAVLRLWQRPRVLHTWFGLALVAVWLTAQYLPQHAWAGLLPTGRSWHDVSTLMSDVHETTTSSVAPVHTTLAIKFILAAMLSLLAALVDLIAVVGRRGALAGVPLLVVYTVSGAVPRHPVSWLLFLGAAAGFLLLLSIDANDEVRGWGRLIPRAGEPRPAAGLAVSGQRIGVIAVTVAVMLPLLTPGRPTNLITNALHNNSGSGGGAGFGAGNGGASINPFAALKSDLNLPKPLNLFTVTLVPRSATEAFYLRTNVLSTYSDKGWSASSRGDGEPLDTARFDTGPGTPVEGGTDVFAAKIDISGLRGNAPLFGRPVVFFGLGSQARWSPQDQLLTNTNVHKGDSYTESVAQPQPTAEQLASAPDRYDVALAPWLAVPPTMPATVSSLVQRLSARRTSPFGRARAISDYFTTAANGFTYSLSTKAGDSGSDLVDFLTNKTGFCQQYAAAMGIMLRLAGIPARVVLGYTHPAPDGSGSFTVTTDDAHAWVEAYFTGLGWIPFDPTPNGGLNGGSKAVLPWAPHRQPTQGGAAGGTASGARATSTKRASVAGQEGPASARAARKTASEPWQLWWGLALLAVLGAAALIPGVARWRRRRGRLRAAGRGDPDPLWAELSDTAVDLGYVWSPARSPRQVVGWLGRQINASGEQSLRTLASAVEVARYAPAVPHQTPQTLVEELRAVEAQLRAERSHSVRIGARLLPASLGWRRVRFAVARRKRR